jgi:hypothetical protein
MGSTTKTPLKKELLQLEHQYWDALKTRDPKALERLTGDNFIMVMEEGINDVSGREFVEMMTGDEMTLKSYEFDESSVTARELSPDVALIAYRAHSDFDRGGKPENMDNYFTTTWCKINGGWKAIAGTAVRAT